MPREMPKFDKTPPQLVARFDELAALVPGATRKQMFGYPSLVLGGNMFMGLFADRMMLRLAEKDRLELISKHGARLFEPMPGRPMKEYVELPASLVDGRGVEAWVARAHAYAASLPAKQPKPARKK